VDKSGKRCPVCDGSGWLWMPDYIGPSLDRRTGERRKQERRNEKKFKHGALE
jgi:hypothetical protein